MAGGRLPPFELCRGKKAETLRAPQPPISTEAETATLPLLGHNADSERSVSSLLSVAAPAPATTAEIILLRFLEGPTAEWCGGDEVSSASSFVT